MGRRYDVKFDVKRVLVMYVSVGELVGSQSCRSRLVL